VAATCGVDCTVKCWDYVKSRLLFSNKFPFPATQLLWVPLRVDEKAECIVVGFADGVVRQLRRCLDSWQLVRVFKPHTAAVTCLSYSQDGSYLVTGAEDGTMFFMSTVGYVPIGFVNLVRSPSLFALYVCPQTRKPGLLLLLLSVCPQN
jgi:WD40 repeat protein